MSKEELLEAMRYGSTSSESVRSENDLGRFGLGLKAASLSQCRKLTVVSKKDKNVSAYRWDYDFIKENKNWDILELNSREINSLPTISELLEKIMVLLLYGRILMLLTSRIMDKCTQLYVITRVK